MPSQSRSSVQRTHSLPVHTSPQTMLMFQQQGVTGGSASAAYLSPTPPPRSTTAGPAGVLEENELISGRCLFRCVRVENPDVLRSAAPDTRACSAASAAGRSRSPADSSGVSQRSSRALRSTYFRLIYAVRSGSSVQHE